MLGYHGCSAATRDRLLTGDPFVLSRNDYDWLGHGAYFWEANPMRGLQWAQQHKQQPCVVGAVIDPGECLDLLSTAGIQALHAAYEEFIRACKQTGTPVPDNAGGPDRLKRKLDCAVIEYFFANFTDQQYDTVRGVFREGKPIYPHSGFYERTHIQICVRKLDCIKGVFRFASLPRS